MVMIKIVACMLGLVLSLTCFSQVTSQANGNYNNNATWVGNAPDANVDNVLILHDVILNVDITIRQNFEVQGALLGFSGKSITVQNSGNLIIGSLSINNDLTVEDNGTLTVQAGDTVYVRNLTIQNSGSLIVEAGGVVYVGIDFVLKNNASAVVDGEVHVVNKFEVKNAASISGNGAIYSGNSVKINSAGSVFGSTEECPGCVYANGCALSTVSTNWTGTTSANWFTASNWSAGLPNEKIPAVILASAPNQPTIGAVGANVFHLTIQPGATLTIAGTNTINIYGNLDIKGAFVANNSTVNFVGACWSAEIYASAPVQFYSLTIANSQNVAVKTGNYSLINTLTVSSGMFETNDSLTLISSAALTARIAEITGGGITGEINMERYVDAGATFWRYFGSAVQGATIAQFNDDFTTAGYPGSLFPNFGWVSAYNYNETLGPGLGYQACTGASQVMGVGEGWQIWCGDTITGTQPFIFDLRGVPNQGDINLPVTFTNTGTPSEDGYNMVCNPYPSTIDWDDADWVKTNMANATYIQNPDNQVYATYVAGASANGGSRYIASQQTFWVQAAGNSPVLLATEGVKSSVDQAFIKSSEPFSPGMLVKLQGNQDADEVVMRHIDGANDAFDPAYDANKYWGGWGTYPQLSILNGDQKDLTVHSFDKQNQEWHIPLRAIVFQSGTYNIEFENTSEMDVPCMNLEDLYTGNIYPISEGTVLSFQMYDTTYAPRFIIHVGRNYELSTLNASCHNGSDGSIELDLDDVNVFDFELIKDGTSTFGNDLVDPLTITGLNSGIYTLHVDGITDMCNQSDFQFVINHPPAISATSVIVDETFGNDGSILVNPLGGTPPFQFLWSNGQVDNVNDNLVAGTYDLIVTDNNGCEFESTYLVNSLLGIELKDQNITYYFDQTQQQIKLFGWEVEQETPVSLYSANGQLIQTFILYPGNTTHTLSVGYISEGIYILNADGFSFKFKK